MFDSMNDKRQQEDGFTLIELLIAIVVVGILSAVAVVGIGSLTDRGESAACGASADAARAASVVHYASNDGVYPDSFDDFDNGELVLPSGAGEIAADQVAVTTNGWTMTMTGGDATAPEFDCA
jgi:prepilin-type N-terminal cleavage/methylation domain-containing protein